MAETAVKNSLMFEPASDGQELNLQEIEFEVEKVLDFRIRDDGLKEYLLKWKGFKL